MRIVDYPDFISLRNEPIDYKEMDRIYTSLKEMSKQYNIRIIVPRSSLNEKEK